MSSYQNIIDIYDTIVEVSDQLHEAKDPDLKGFDKALFMLHHALKNFEGINMHLENRKLVHQVKTHEKHLTGVINAYQAQQYKLQQYKNKIAQLEKSLSERKKPCPCTQQEKDLKNISEMGFSNNG